MAFVRSGAEELFGIELTVGEGEARASMPVGPWLVGPDGLPSAGALGVLADDTFGYAVNAAAPGGGWSSTTELSVTFVRPLPTSGRVHGRALVAASDAAGGVARGELRDDAGELVAYGHGRNRYVAIPPPLEAISSGRVAHGLELPAPGEAAGLLAILGDVEVAEPGLRLTLGPRLGNPRGTLHGGISLALCELAAVYAVPGLSTTSASTHYLRPAPIGTRLLVEPTVRHRGRTLAVVEVSVRREDGAECVRATVVREASAT
ncbi:PaaI family thioesterase [Nocardioides mangrovi]|uniref:PaaI family thioesterase n=1 Tax=Nocardioides mangrovi TaxID=2874580 RepID=A0ABS7UBQ1_9ACTN|nr:PaaI family thioesterase [Nocardioides mangrovi]MBZ5738415.1 PaaI family thioesterase [Nocardioides mangrovi]